MGALGITFEQHALAYETIVRNAVPAKLNK